MSRPGFIEGAGVALAASVGGAFALAVLGRSVGDADALRLVSAGLGLAYLAYLLVRSRAVAGRLVVPLLWAAATGALALLDAPAGLVVLVQCALVWLTRSLWFHDGVLTALADLGLIAAGLAAAGWALEQSASPGLALWCLFLAQALFTTLPVGRGPGAPGRRLAAARSVEHARAFERAYGSAEAALGRLTIRR